MNQQIWSAINFTLVDFNIFVAVHTAIWWTIYTTNLFVIHGRVLSLAYCLQLFYSYRTRSWIIVLPHRKTCQQCCPELLTEDCEGFADLYVVAPALWLHPVVFGLHIMKPKKNTSYVEDGYVFTDLFCSFHLLFSWTEGMILPLANSTLISGETILSTNTLDQVLHGSWKRIVYKNQAKKILTIMNQISVFPSHCFQFSLIMLFAPWL